MLSAKIRKLLIPGSSVLHARVESVGRNIPTTRSFHDAVRCYVTVTWNRNDRLKLRNYTRVYPALPISSFDVESNNDITFRFQGVCVCVCGCAACLVWRHVGIRKIAGFEYIRLTCHLQNYPLCGAKRNDARAREEQKNCCGFFQARNIKNWRFNLTAQPRGARETFFPSLHFNSRSIRLFVLITLILRLHSRPCTRVTESNITRNSFNR